jgi:hypothetical protein
LRRQGKSTIVDHRGAQLKSSTPFKKSLSLLFIGFYLIFGGALGHAFVWCAEPGDFTHLEYNPAGDCGIQCAADAPVTPASAGGAAVDSPACEDRSSKTLFSEISSPQVDNPSPAPARVAADTLPGFPWSVPPQHVSIFSPIPAPDRPPTNVQRALKTVVLLH